jgi:hypothetical protein
MRKLALIAILATASMATPALAQTGVGAIGIGNLNGNLATSANTSLDVVNSTTLDVSIDNTLSAASGSGFVGDLTLGAGASAAQLHMTGIAGSLAGSLGNAAYSLSGNDMDLNGAVQGNGSLTGQVVNFGQSEFTNSFTFDYSRENSFEFSENQAQAANVNFSGQGVFGTFGFEN